MPPAISGSSASSPRRLHDDREVDQVATRSVAAGRSAVAPAPIPTTAQEKYGSEAAFEALEAFNDGILYVGMNPKSMRDESDALARVAKVERVFTHEGAAVSFDGASYDLSNKEEIAGFARALAEKYGLSATTGSAVASVLEGATLDGRDELAQIAMVWARAESGRIGERPIPSRLVISGHHAGGSFSGLRDASIFALARAMPHAAKQIEDVHFAGCMSEEHVNVRDDVKHAFPNLKSVWGYSGYSPEAPVHHLHAWANATRGRADKIASAPGRESAVAWSVDGGIVGKQKSLDDRRRECREADGRFEAYKAGTLGNSWVTDADYAAYQSIAQSNAPRAEREAAAAKAAVLLRVRKYDHVRERFDEVYGERLREACSKAGIETPRFASLSRKEGLQRIAAIEDAGAVFDPELLTKLQGLAALDQNVVLDTWCF